MWVLGGDTVGLATRFVSSTQVTAVVPAALLGDPGTAQVFVETMTTTGTARRSNAADFRITTPDPDPKAIAITPTSAYSGSPAVTLTIRGSGFAPALPHHFHSQAVVVAAGDSVPLATSFVNSTQLAAVLPAGLLSRPTSFQVLVQTGDPMDDLPLSLSAPARFSVLSTGPSGPPITISPTSVVGGSSAVTLTVTGSGFSGLLHLSNSQVVWTAGGSTVNLATSFVSSTQLTALVPAELVAGRTDAQIFVQTADLTDDNPPILSQPADFTVTNPFPIRITPSQAAAGAHDLILTITGEGFAPALPSHYHSQVVWLAATDTVLLATSSTSSRRLTAVVPARLLKRAGTFRVSVWIGDPMGDIALVHTAERVFEVTDHN
jgi:hypothetical protein